MKWNCSSWIRQKMAVSGLNTQIDVYEYLWLQRESDGPRRRRVKKSKETYSTGGYNKRWTSLINEKIPPPPKSGWNPPLFLHERNYDSFWKSAIVNLPLRGTPVYCRRVRCATPSSLNFRPPAFYRFTACCTCQWFSQPSLSAPPHHKLS